MTYIYQVNGFPQTVSVCCPNCQKEAHFTFVSYSPIKLRKDIPYFQDSPYFEYKKMPNTGTGGWHGAFFYHGLHIKDLASITDLPEGFKVEDWRRYYGDERAGTLICYHCDLRKKHVLDWRKEAYFQISYKNKVLWAYDRETAGILGDYVASTERKPDQYGRYLFLVKLPAHFLVSKARAAVVKKLDALLARN